VSLRPQPSVLVVDADQESRRPIIHALQEAGMAGAEALSYSDAVDRIQGFAYDGLILVVRGTGGEVSICSIWRPPATPVCAVW